MGEDKDELLGAYLSSSSPSRSLSWLLSCSLAPPSDLLRIRSIFILPLRTRSKTPCPSLNLSTDVGTIQWLDVWE